MASSTLTADWRKALSTRKGSKSGWMRRLNSKAAALDADPLTEIVTDPNSWSASAVISTPTPDRSQDVVHPMGCMLENYKKNPVVFFDHGFSGLMVPVGISESPEGLLTVVVSDTDVQATTFFDREIEESRQIFKLIQAKFLRTTSIGFEPIDVQFRKGFQPDEFGNGPLEVFTWELLEYSWTGIPCNPEAVRKLIDRRRIDDEPLTDVILKSFAPYAAPLIRAGRGWTPEKPTVAKTIRKDDTPTPEDDPNKPADDTVKDDSVPADQPPADEPNEEATESPLGMQVMGAAFNALSTLAAQVDSAMGPLENPSVKEYLAGLSATLNGCLGEMQSAFKEAYPDGDELKPAEPEADQSVAKFLAANSGNRMQVAGLAHKLKGLQAAKNLTASQKSELATISLRLNKLAADARKAAPKAADPEVAELAELKKSIASTAKKIEELLPVSA